MRKEIELLKHHADLLAQRLQRSAIGTRPRILVAFRGERAIDPDRPALNGFERGETAQQGALAGATWSDDDEDLTAIELEVHVVRTVAGP